MPKVIVDGQDLVVGLSWLEKLGAFRGNVRVPLRAVRSAEAEPDPWGALRGIRAPGTGIPGVIAFGTRRFDGGKDFAAVRGGRPAVRVDLGDLKVLPAFSDAHEHLMEASRNTLLVPGR